MNLHKNFFKTQLLKYFDFTYFIKFLAILGVLYCSHLFFIGLAIPGNFYSEFFAENLYYITWVRESILYTANLIVSLFGIESTLDNYNGIRTVNGASVAMWYPCIGFGIMAFWIAFVTAHKSSLKNKVLWCTTGILTIWFLNCWRVALLLIALDKEWKENKYIDHHDLFNYIVYSLLISLIFLYSSKTSMKPPNGVYPNKVKMSH